MRRAAEHCRLAVAVLALVAGCSTPAEPPARVRVPGRAGSAHTTLVAIDGTWRQALDPGRAEQTFALDELPPRPRLKLAAGLTTAARAGAVRFEAVLEPAHGAPRVLYMHEQSAAGWDAAEVDLAPLPVDGARLVLRAPALQDAVWAEPVVVSAAPAAPSAILVSIDSLRADRLGVYGATDVATPTLDALARAGGWYAQAYTSSTWTLPSHTCLLYGMTFGTLFHGCEYTCEPFVADPVRPLPQLLQEQGWATAAFTGGGYVSPRFGFARGFDSYYVHTPPSGLGRCAPDRLDGEGGVARASAWLRGLGQAPFFLFLHTYEVHDQCPLRPAEADDVVHLWPDPGPEERARVRAYFDGQVSRVDGLLGRLFAVLDELGRRDTTLVVVTSDHGQAFWEHGFEGHGCPLKPYHELARVPLLVRYPASGWRPGRVDTPVSTVDLAPTILHALGQPVPPWIEGAPLPGFGAPAGSSRPIWVQCGDVLALRAGDRKLITSLSGRFSDELYDLAHDPDERQNLATRDDPTEAALRDRVAGYWRAAAGAELARPAPPPDAETQERLRALGYVDGNGR